MYIYVMYAQLHATGLRGGDGTIRNSYRLLGAASLLQLLITVALQLSNFRQKQRARQEWRLCRKLRYVLRHREAARTGPDRTRLRG